MAAPEHGTRRQDAADTLSAASSFVEPAKTGMGQKIAIATTLYRLARRYPLPALLVGGVVLAYYLSHRHDRTLHYSG
jgi:hypothetical protein